MRVLFALIFVLFSVPAHAVVPAVERCGNLDTATYSTGGTTIIGLCEVVAGPTGIIFAMATAETLCNPDLKSQIVIGSGSTPVRGSNFFGGISSGTLTVEETIPGMGDTIFLVLPDQIVYGNQAPITQTTVVAQLTQTSYTNSSLSWSGNEVTVTTSGTHHLVSGNSVIISGVTPSGYNGVHQIYGETSTTFKYGLISDPGPETVPGIVTASVGGIGTYSVADSMVSVSPTTNLYSVIPTADLGSTTAIMPRVTQTDCDDGKFVITTISGATQLTPGATYWLTVIVGSAAATYATWNNGSLTVFTY